MSSLKQAFENSAQMIDGVLFIAWLLQVLSRHLCACSFHALLTKRRCTHHLSVNIPLHSGVPPKMTDFRSNLVSLMSTLQQVNQI